MRHRIQTNTPNVQKMSLQIQKKQPKWKAISWEKTQKRQKELCELEARRAFQTRNYCTPFCSDAIYPFHLSIGWEFAINVRSAEVLNQFGYKKRNENSKNKQIFLFRLKMFSLERAAAKRNCSIVVWSTRQT